MAAQTPTPINTTLPGAYQGQEVDAESAYQQALTNIATQQKQAMQSYGLTGNINQDTGAIEDEKIDPNDQYSQVMGLLNTHAGNMQQLRNGLLGRGLGKSGLSAQQQALLKFSQSGETANLGNQFSQQLGNLFSQQQGALTTRNQAFSSAEQAALLAQITAQGFDTAKAAAAKTSTDDTSAGATPKTTAGAGAAGPSSAPIAGATTGVSAYSPSYVGTQAIKPQATSAKNFYTDVSLGAQSGTSNAAKLAAATIAKNPYMSNINPNIH